MKPWIAIFALAGLTACNDLLIADVQPEKRDCSDTTYTIDTVMNRNVQPKECKTGRLTVKWGWEN